MSKQAWDPSDESIWERVVTVAKDHDMTTWLGVDERSGEVVAQVNETGQIVCEGRGTTSNKAIQQLASALEATLRP